LFKKALTLLAIGIMVLATNGNLMQPILPSEAEEDLYSLCQDIINCLNGTLTRYNSTIACYNGTNSVPADDVNISIEVHSIALDCINWYNQSLSEISQYEDLLEEVYVNLSEIKGNYLDLNDNIIALSAATDDINSSGDDVWTYLDNNYDKETINESNYNAVTSELLNDSTFNSLADTFMIGACKYLFNRTNVTDRMWNITRSLSQCRLNHFTKLAYEEENVIESKQEDTSKQGDENKTEKSINETLQQNASKTDSSTDSLTIEKLLTNNKIKNTPTLEYGLSLASVMNVKIIRNDFNWNDLYTNRPGTYLWLVNDGKYNIWKQELVPEMIGTDNLNMGTLVTIKCTECPGWKYDTYHDGYLDHWDEYSQWTSWYDELSSIWLDMLNQRAALWTSWSYIHENMGQFTGQYAYIYPLLRQLNDKIGINEALDYSIRGFCIENEPNIWQPYAQNHATILIPSGTQSTCYWKWVWVWDGWHSGPKYLPQFSYKATFTTYSTEDMVLDELVFIKNKILNDPLLPNLRGCKTVVNLHSFGDNWESKAWEKVRKSSSLDILGIDLYRTHGESWAGICSDIQKVKYLADQQGKQWWIVETEGASGPSHYWGAQFRSPTCEEIVQVGDEARTQGVKVIGFYKLWGDYSGPTGYDKAYNIYQNPSMNPTASTDKNGHFYYVNIRDHFNN
jgi:hypothetical protein